MNMRERETRRERNHEIICVAKEGVAKRGACRQGGLKIKAVDK